MTITRGQVQEIALRYGVDPEIAVQMLRDAGLTVVPNFAGRDRQPGDSVPTDRLHECDLVGERNADDQVWVVKSSVGSRRKFVSLDTWYRLAEVVAQSGGQVYLHEWEVRSES